MTIPDYQSIMLPLLLLADDGAEHRVSDATERLAEEFELSPEERLFLLPSGRQAAFSKQGWLGSDIPNESGSPCESSARTLSNH